MISTLGITLLWLAAAPPAGPISFQRLGEVKLPSSSLHYRMLDRQRYYMLNTQYEKTAQGVEGTFVIADLLEPKAFWVPFHFSQFRQANPGLSLCTMRSIPFFKKDRALLCAVRDTQGQSGEPAPLPRYCFWKPGNPLGCKPRELGNVRPAPPFSLHAELGPDPVEKYLYSAILVYDKDPVKREDDPQKQAKLRSVRLFRFPLTDDSLTSDWEMEFEIPLRDIPLSLRSSSSVVFSADGRKLAFIEYHDLSAAKQFTPVPPPQVYVVDTETKKATSFPIPVTAYGVTFSRDGKYLAVGSFETRELLRINLEAGKIDRRVKSPSSIDGLFTTAKGDKLFVFSGRSTSPRPIQVRRWSDLKLVQQIPIESLFPGRHSMDPSFLEMTADGRHLVTTFTGDDGFSTQEGVVIFEVKER